MSKSDALTASTILKTTRIIPSKSSFEQSPEFICRICMEQETISKNLISPCSCIGTVKFVHEECLKTWIVSTSQDIGKSKCELCKSDFEMKFYFSKECNIKKSCNHGWAHFIYIPVLSIVMLLMFAIIALMSTNIIVLKTDNAVGYKISLMICCGIVGFFLIIILYSLTRDLCIVKKLKNWKIASKISEKEVFSPENDSSETLIHEMNMKHSLVVPENTIVNGETIETPILHPNLEQFYISNHITYCRKELSCWNSLTPIHGHSNSDPSLSHFSVN